MWRIFGRKRTEADLDNELSAHIAIEARQLMDAGLPPDAAEAEARRRFGSRAFVAEATRDAWRPRWMASARQDLRYAARTLRRTPAFTLAAVLSLGLGIGASTVVFSIADTVYLRPLPYRASEELVWVAIKLPGLMDAGFLPSPDYVAWRRDNRVFTSMAAMQFNGGQPAILGDRDPEEVHGVRVSANFLDTLGIVPQIGRAFRDEEERPNGPKAMLLTDGLWRRRFRADPGVIGSAVAMDGQTYTVVGVLPPSFVFPMEVKPDVLTTLPVLLTASHNDQSMSAWTAFARLKPGMSLNQAQANVQTLYAATKADAPKMFRNDAYPAIEPLRRHRAGDSHALLGVLAGAVACLLLIACGNVANLSLARWSARSRELAVRAAIGAGRARLVRQLVTESALLSAAGCVLGMALVVAGLRGFVHFAAGSLPRLVEVTADGRVLAIALAVSAATTLLFGVVPALRAGRVDIRTVLQRAGRGVAGGHAFLRRALVGGEVALSLVLLTGAALMFQTLRHMEHDHLGFPPERVISASIPLRGSRLEKANRAALTAEVLEYVRRLPGVEAAGAAECTPLTGGPSGLVFTRLDRPLPEAFHRGDGIAVCGVGVGYFQAAGVHVVRGRVMTEADYDHINTVAVINEAAARVYFPGEDPIGRQVGGGRAGNWKTLIGVVADSKNHGLNEPAAPQMFVNNLAFYGQSDLRVVARYAGSEGTFAANFRAWLHEVDPGMLARFETLDEAIGRMSSGARFNSVLLGSFAAAALLMAIVGVYGVLAFAVAQRTQEIGIRVALGAAPAAVRALVLREGLLLAGLGMAAGIAGSIAAGRYLKSLLYDVAATDLRTYAVVVTALALAALAAAWIPARRAAGVDPMAALRDE